MPEPIQISLAAARVNARLTQEEAAKRMNMTEEVFRSKMR